MHLGCSANSRGGTEGVGTKSVSRHALHRSADARQPRRDESDLTVFCNGQFKILKRFIEVICFLKDSQHDHGVATNTEQTNNLCTELFVIFLL
jgi:hypothetical protein